MHLKDQQETMAKQPLGNMYMGTPATSVRSLPVLACIHILACCSSLCGTQVYTGLQIFVADLLKPSGTFVHATVHGGRNSKRAANDGTEARKEARERLGALLAVDDLHW